MQLLAISWSWGCLGILTVQVCKRYLASVRIFPIHSNFQAGPPPTDLYYRALSKDRLALKTAVMAVFALEALQTILLTKSAFLCLSIGFDNPEGLGVLDAFWFSVPIMCGIGRFPLTVDLSLAH